MNRMRPVPALYVAAVTGLHRRGCLGPALVSAIPDHHAAEWTERFQRVRLDQRFSIGLKFRFANTFSKLFKNIAFRERVSLRTGANFSNLFNRHQWCDPNTNLSDAANFGLSSGQCDVPRRIEVYTRFTF